MGQYICLKNPIADDAKAFLLDKLGVEEIRGEFYDKDLLAVAKKSLKDGAIELGEAKELWKSAMDGKKVTEIEAKTLEFIIANNKISEDAKAFLLDKLGLEEVQGQFYDKDLLKIAKKSM